MISAASRPYIDASVPVLRQHGQAITTTFYRNMFAAHPELTNLFNMGNQASGVQQQSLASALFAYAANIDNMAALAPVASRIAHKHASVGLRADHYPIVGFHLLGAIREVLGEAATEPLLKAWEEAYGSLARVLIDAEAKMYLEAGIEAGQLRPMRVVEVTRESENVIAIRMIAADGGALQPFSAGQYVSVEAVFDDGRRQLRQYSVSDALGKDSLRISVKREDVREGVAPAGAVSNWLHRNVEVGSVLQVSHPFGDFLPDTESDTPVVLLSAGVGITPMIAALNRIARVHPDRRVIFAHAARSSAYHPHQEDIAAAQARMPHLQVVSFYEQDAGAGALPGQMAPSRLPSWPRGETDVYLCGPLPFMQAQWKALLAAGVPADRLHREVFGPDLLDHLL